jgi:hypothetical protein
MSRPATLGSFLLIAAAALTVAAVDAGAQMNQAIPHPPGRDVTATAGGETRSQPVGEADVELAVELTGAEQAEIGRPYALTVTVHNHAPSAARSVRVPLVLSVTATDGAVADPRAVIEYAGAEPVACPRSGRDRECAFGDIPSGESRSTTLRIEPRRSAPAGQMVVSATARTDGRLSPDSQAQPRRVIRLVTSARQQLDVDLQVSVQREATVVGAGERFAYIVEVRNASDRSEATEVELELRSRFGVREQGKFRRAGTGSRWTVSAGPADVRRLTVDATVVDDLEPGRWGRLEVQARVSSAENDPAGADNVARVFTNVVSRRPEIAFVARVRDARGQAVSAPVERLAVGEVFGITARFMSLAVEPTGTQPSIRVSVDGGESVQLTLSQLETIGSDRVFRSAPVRIVAPGQDPPAADQGVRVIRARLGRTVKAVYEATYPGSGPVRSEATITVGARQAPPTGPGGTRR